MKNIIALLALAVMGVAQAQVIIGDKTGTATDKNSVLLEFAKGDKGIILPYVTTKPATPAEGTILVDASNANAAKVEYYKGSWVDLSSGNTANISTAMAQQPSTTEDAAAKTIIGAPTSTADGVLVLESKTKVMVLPQVDSTDAILDPAPGMMVYIKKAGAKRLAVFNGAKWTFWKPN